MSQPLAWNQRANFQPEQPFRATGNGTAVQYHLWPVHHFAGYVGTNPSEVYQHGTIGKFIRSEMEGTQSSYLKCIYQAKDTANNTVTLLCEKRENCCVDGCCPKDQYWFARISKLESLRLRMAGVYVLLTFVLLVFLVGTPLMIICYQRSKNKQRKEEREAYEYGGGYAGSQVGAPAAYGSYIGPANY